MAIELSMIRCNLEQEHKRLIEELDLVKAGGNSDKEQEKASSFHRTEEAADATTDLQRQAALETQMRNRLAGIEHALDKIESGTYGICDKCGGQIDPKRLEALPESTLCVTCKAEAEKHASPSNNYKLVQPIFINLKYERVEAGDD